jgi:hypothetical protein
MQLPEYTGCTTAIDVLKALIVFARRALPVAKMTKRFTETEAVTEERYLVAATVSRDPTSKLLLPFCWAFAARVRG